MEAFKKWLNVLDLSDMPQDALAELFQILEAAEDKPKIALIDLLRLLLLSEGIAGFICHKHWETFDVSMFQYIQCLDIKDPADKTTANYHLISLKMLCNLYHTKTAQEFVAAQEPTD